IHVTGSVKYDGLSLAEVTPRTEELRTLLGVQPGHLVWVCGSTQAPEEEIAVDLFGRLCGEHPHLRLFLVPRQRDRFEEVAGLLRSKQVPFVRRSTLAGPTSARVVLVDTMGELSALWGLADLAFV